MKNLSTPPFFLAALGPSFLFTALSLNGGEILLWPNLVTNYSLTLLWFIPLILTMQWATNVEISRATAYNGSLIIRELATNRFLRPFLAILLVITLGWPAWMSVAASTVSYFFGIPTGLTPLVAIAGMLLLLPAWRSKKYYNIIEKIAKYGLTVVLISVISVVGYFLATSNLKVRFDTVWIVSSYDWPLLYAAVAYGGVAGILNFTQAGWIKSRGYAGSNIVVDYSLPSNQKKYVQWMSFIAKESFSLFWVGNLVGISLIALLAVSTLARSSVTGFPIIIAQLVSLELISPLLSWVWGVGIVSLFVMAQLTIMDAAGRLWVDITGREDSQKPLVSQGFVLIAILIFLLSFVVPAFKQPSFLLQLSAGMASFSFSFLPLLVLWYNHTHLPQFAKASWWQTFLVVACAVFYGGMTVIFLVTQFKW